MSMNIILKINPITNFSPLLNLNFSFSLKMFINCIHAPNITKVNAQ